MIDVLIIGSGGAGLSAALAAKEKSDNILVVSKTYATHSQTVQAQGGINAVLIDNSTDNINKHTNETYNSSKKLANKKNIYNMCSNAKDTISWLDNIGVPFSRNKNGTIKQRYFGGTKAQRTCYSSDYTGLKIIHTLYDNCIKNEINFLNEHILIDLIVENNRVLGASFLNLINSEIKDVYSKTTILATGGYSNIYSGHTTNTNSTTGDGIAIAYKNGAQLSNMEFIQFHPTALVNSNTLISESARAEGAYLVTKDEKRFTDELATRDIVAREIEDKILEGENVYLDLRHLDEIKLKANMPQEIKLISDLLNLDIKKDLIPINPAAHYTMGGILTDVSCETSIENLFASGECAQSNIHGANRLGGNSLLEIISLGRTSGREAVKKSKKIKDKKTLISRKININELLNKKGTEELYKIKKELGDILFKNVGLYREKEQLENTLKHIEILKDKYNKCEIKDKSRVYNKNLLEYIEIGNLLEIANLVTISALKRDESRGSHYRKDKPNENIKLEKISIIYNEKNKMIHEFREIV